MRAVPLRGASPGGLCREGEAMPGPGKLTAGPDGKIRGPASITYNSPFPCVNGDPGGMSVPHGIQGLVMHTMVGNLPGTVAVFNDPSRQASAHFGVDQAGNIRQFGSVRGWKAWAQEAGNPHWYSCEFADDGNPDNPLTPAQITAGAQLLECLSAPSVGNFPLQVTDSTSGEGLGVHFMGGAAWGGHTCPDLPPQHVRSAQRPQIVALAMAIRSGAPTTGWTAAMIADLPTLQQGSKDTAGRVYYVHRAKALMKVIGEVNSIPSAACLPVDGTFDAATKTAVEAIQTWKKITADGQIGPQTWGVLITGSAG